MDFKLVKVDVETHKKLKVLSAEMEITMKELIKTLVQEAHNGK